MRLTYRTCVLGGCAIAIAFATLFATRAGLTPLVWIAIAAFAVASALFLAAATKVLFGVESFAFLHYQIVAVVATAIVAPSALNLIALTLAVAQAIGRLGCASAGCCYGRAGIPVQKIESAVLFAIAAVCAMNVEHAFVIYALAYAIARFALELLRGDRRRHLLGISEAQWICVATSIVMIAVDAIAIPVAAALVVATIARLRFETPVRVSHGSTDGVDHYTLSAVRPLTTTDALSFAAGLRDAHPGRPMSIVPASREGMFHVVIGGAS